MGFDDDEWNLTLAEDTSTNTIRVSSFDGRTRNEPLDWRKLLSGDLPPRQYLAGDLFEAGQQIALVGEGKVGKSLFSLDMVRALTNGLPFLGAPARPPVRCMYVDRENDQRTLLERSVALGITPEDFENVVYFSFPSVPPLDTHLGGQLFMEEVQRVNPQVVFIDTISRFIDGRENDADTWISLYNYTLVHLKAAGIAVVRLDHFGKDASRGARGNSAKSQDVDHVYELSKVRSGPGFVDLSLYRSFTRSGGGSEERALTRYFEWNQERRCYMPGSTKHVYKGDPIEEIPLELPGSPPPLPKLTQRATEMVELLDKLNVDVKTSVKKSAAILRGADQTVSQLDLAAAVKFRKVRGPKVESDNMGELGTVTPTVTPTVTATVDSDRNGDRNATVTTHSADEFSQVNSTVTVDRNGSYRKGEDTTAKRYGQEHTRVACAPPERLEGPEEEDVTDWPSVPPPSE